MTTMIYEISLMLLFMNSVRYGECNQLNRFVEANYYKQKFALWPSFHNGVTSMKIRKREAIATLTPTLAPTLQTLVPNAISLPISEGGGSLPTNQLPSYPAPDASLATKQVSPNISNPLPEAGSVLASQSSVNETGQVNQGLDFGKGKVALPTPNSNATILNSTNLNITVSNNNLNITNPVNTSSNITNATTTVTKTEDPGFDWKDPGVLKRSVIVFGGFTLLAVAYYIFYRRKNKKDTINGHNVNDVNQFRYGVLLSEDTRDKMELSRVPLTMDSEDEEEDDLEIFDLEQKKKSLSYVNLQINDEEVVNVRNDDIERDNLLVDIDDRGTDTLIDWSNSGNKSIL